MLRVCLINLSLNCGKTRGVLYSLHQWRLLWLWWHLPLSMVWAVAWVAVAAVVAVAVVVAAAAMELLRHLPVTYSILMVT